MHTYYCFYFGKRDWTILYIIKDIILFKSLTLELQPFLIRVGWSNVYDLQCQVKVRVHTYQIGGKHFFFVQAVSRGLDGSYNGEDKKERVSSGRAVFFTQDLAITHFSPVLRKTTRKPVPCFVSDCEVAKTLFTENTDNKGG